MRMKCSFENKFFFPYKIINNLSTFFINNKGIMSDVFPEKKRALVMAIFNWGIYGGYGIAFPVGRYITKLNIWELVCIAVFNMQENFYNEMFFISYILIISVMADLLLWYWCFGCDCCDSNWNDIERTRTKINW